MNTALKTFIPLDRASDPLLCGRKAFNLALLCRSGFRVPPGFVIPAGTPAAALAEELEPAFAALGAASAAVRSSAAAEDGRAASFAGQFDSFLGVRAAGLKEAVAACLASAGSARAAAYGGAPGPMAVIVQELVEPEISGVAFTCNPVTGYKGELVIEAVWGLCEPLVAGRLTPDHYELDKAGLWQKDKKVAAQDEQLVLDPAGGTRTAPVPEELRREPKLDEAALRLVAQAALRAEALFDAPADIEWALKGGKLYLLQARPVTGLGD